MKNKRAPIAVFTYNRLTHTKRTIESLRNNNGAKESVLYVFSDGYKNEEDKESVINVRKYLYTITGFLDIKIVESKENKGLANSIIQGISLILNTYEKVIVLEDDLITSQYFLNYMNEALNYYNHTNIWSIAGYSPPIKQLNKYIYNTFLVHRNCSWGWATWKENWNKVDWELNNLNEYFTDKNQRKMFERGGNDLTIMLLKQIQRKISSWSIIFNFAAFKNNLPTAYPIKSLINNIGADGSGTNMKRSYKYKTNLYNETEFNPEIFCPENEINENISTNFKRFYNCSIYRRIINFIKLNTFIYKQKRLHK